MEELIDGLIGNQGLDSDVAKVIYPMFRGKYRYTGNSRWEYKRNDDIWVNDERAERLWTDVLAFSNNALIQRAIYWENKNEPLKQFLFSNKELSSTSANEIRLQMDDHSAKSIRLLQISRKFKQASYKKLLLQELKSYFVE
jgi:hypothetical protein